MTIYFGRLFVFWRFSSSFRLNFSEEWHPTEIHVLLAYIDLRFWPILPPKPKLVIPHRTLLGASSAPSASSSPSAFYWGGDLPSLSGFPSPVRSLPGLITYLHNPPATTPATTSARPCKKYLLDLQNLFAGLKSIYPAKVFAGPLLAAIHLLSPATASVPRAYFHFFHFKFIQPFEMQMSRIDPLLQKVFAGPLLLAIHLPPLQLLHFNSCNSLNCECQESTRPQLVQG